MPETATSRHASHRDWPVCRKCLGTTELPAGSGKSRSCEPALDGCTGTGREGPPQGWVDAEHIDIPGVGVRLLPGTTDSEQLAAVEAGAVKVATREEIQGAIERLAKILRDYFDEPPRRRGFLGGRGGPEAA